MKKYTNDDYCVYYEKEVIAKLYTKSNGGREIRIAQGMPRQEVINKIIADCPKFCEDNKITEKTWPLLF